jgi:hypothetical protein
VLEYNKTDLSKDSKVTLLDTTGKSTELGVIKPGENKTFQFTAGAEGIYQVKMAAQDLLVAVLKSNVPAGVMPRDIAQNVRTSTGTLYFYVPKGTPDFAVRVWSGAFGKWHSGVGVTIRDPRGKEFFSSKNALNGVAYTAPASLAKKGGIWSVTFSAPKGDKKYIFWNYNFRILGASPYLGLRADRIPVLER